MDRNFRKGHFLGKKALDDQTRIGPPRRLIAFEVLEKSVPRHGFTILDAMSSQPIGIVTSGNLSPLLQKGIGLGYVPPSLAEAGTAISIDIRGKSCRAVVVKPPFYRKTKTKKRLTPSGLHHDEEPIHRQGGHAEHRDGGLAQRSYDRLEVVRHPGAAAVVPLTADGSVVLIR